MINKQRQLISEIGINEPDVLSVKNNWQILINSYDIIDYPTQRKILLFRDYYLASKLDLHGANIDRDLLAFALKISIDFNTYPELIKLIIEKRKRQKLKHFNYSPISLA